MKTVFTPEEAEEFRRLFAEHQQATAEAGLILATHGMESDEFRAADRKITELWVQLRKLQGMDGQHWMA